MTDKEIAMTIVEQMGGAHMLGMIGAKAPLLALDRTAERLGGVTIRWTHSLAKDGIRSVRVELTPMDEYRVEFFGRAPQCISKAKFHPVYCDELQGLFEDVTGLQTNLFGRRVQFGWVNGEEA